MLVTEEKGEMKVVAADAGMTEEEEEIEEVAEEIEEVNYKQDLSN